MRFTKGHGTGNDFVVLPDPDDRLELTPAFVRALCNRRTGLGADGVLRVVRAEGAGWFMDYRNADGSLAEMCGNGIRVFARYLVDTGLAPAGRLEVATRDGMKAVDTPRTGDVTVEMGPALLAPAEPVVVRLGGRDWPARGVTTGNPHAVVLGAGDLQALDLSAAPVVSARQFPDGVNVEFVDPVGERHVKMRVHERGVGETMSCGTGACAAAVATLAAQDAHGAVTVDVPGGRLQVVWREDGTVTLAGPAVLVADGQLRPEWLTAAGG